MTTHKEALKLALEALENLINQHYAETTTNDDLEKADKAITAIKEALAQPEQFKPLTDEQIDAGRRSPWGENLDAFTAGVRFAEAAHSIKVDA